MERDNRVEGVVREERREWGVMEKGEEAKEEVPVVPPLSPSVIALSTNPVNGKVRMIKRLLM